jgi:D-alanyl-D-alanine carboxypeptidase
MFARLPYWRPNLNNTALIEHVHALLDVQAATDRFSGAVLVAHDDQPLVATARGYAIHPNVLPNQPDTKFDIASVTKMFTAVAVMQLVASGNLDLSTPISAYNLDLPNTHSITIHHLLTHTAGFGDYWNDAYRAARSDLRTVTDYLRLFATTPLACSPGTRHHYSNAGYVVLGAIIEYVTGQSYYDHIRLSIYQPAAMSDSDHYALDLPIANRAVGYTSDMWGGPADGLRRTNQFIYAVRGSPASNGFSTVHDLFRFFQALQTHRLLDTQHTELCCTAHVTSEQPGVSYGYGFHILDDDQHGRVIGHGGRAFGGDAFALMYRDLGYTVIVLSNYDRPAARHIIDAIAAMLIR